MVSWVKSGIKLWNREKIETDGTWLRRGRQFHFFPTESGRFHNFSHFNSWNHSQFHFLTLKDVKKASIFRQFHVKLAPQKKVRFLAKTFTIYLKSCLRPSFKSWVSFSNSKLEKSIGGVFEHRAYCRQAVKETYI